MPKRDPSIDIFYNELLDRITQDPFENSYAEFSYTFKTQNKLFNGVNMYITDKTDPFYKSFMVLYALYNIRIKGLDFIECYINSYPMKRGKITNQYVVKFTVLFEKH